MSKFLADFWKKSNISIYIVLATFLYSSFHAGLYFREKNLKENKKLSIETANLEKNSLKNKIFLLKSQVGTLESDRVELEGNLHSVEVKYDKSVLRLQGISHRYSLLKKSSSKTIKEIREVLENKRPYLDYTMKTKNSDDNSGVSFSVYNKSKIPLKIIGTDYRSWSNGVEGNKRSGVTSAILYPKEKNNIVFFFSNRGEIDWRGAVCAKYTTLNKRDIRFWIYEIWFLYESKSKKFNVVSVIDNSVSSNNHCNLEKTKIAGWIKH